MISLLLTLYLSNGYIGIIHIYQSLKITTISVNSMVEVLNHPPLECHFYDYQWFVITTFCPIFTILQVDYHHLLQLLSPGVNSYISYSVSYFTDISICTYSSPFLFTRLSCTDTQKAQPREELPATATLLRVVLTLLFQL